MPQPSYTYACARISALEKRLFSRAEIRRMAESSLDDVMRMLLDARYGEAPDATPADCERMIDHERVQTAKTIQELSPRPELTDLLLLQTDVHNLKVLIKARLLGSSEFSWQEGGLYSREKLASAVGAQSYADMPAGLGAALDELERRLKIREEPQLVSVLLDYGFLTHALSVSKDAGEAFVEQYVQALCDFNNVLTFLRMRAMGAPKEDLKGVLLPDCGIRRDALLDAYELNSDSLAKALSGSVARDAMNRGLSDMLVSGNIGMLEKQRDNYLLSLVNDHRHDTMTLFPIFGYFLARDREARAIRLIVTVKRNGLEDGVITERLRELYG